MNDDDGASRRFTAQGDLTRHLTNWERLAVSAFHSEQCHSFSQRQPPNFLCIAEDPFGGGVHADYPSCLVVDYHAIGDGCDSGVQLGRATLHLRQQSLALLRLLAAPRRRTYVT
jgi:hypothetical protein